LSDVSDALGQVGPGEQFTSLGEVWSLAPVGPGLRAEYSTWAKREARQLITASKAYLTALEVKEDLGDYREALDAGEYDWGPPPPDGVGMGEAISAILSGIKGQMNLVRVLLRPKHGDVPIGRVASIVQGADSDELQEALGRCLNGPNESALPASNGKRQGKTNSTQQSTVAMDDTTLLEAIREAKRRKEIQ
jgi:hypothetical protein